MNASLPPVASPWSPQQRRWLQALGHPVLRIGGNEEATVAEARDGQVDADDRPAAMPRQAEQGGSISPARPTGPRHAPPVPAGAGGAGEGAAPVAAARAPARRPARLPDRLQLALLRASGLDPADPAAQAAMAQWPVDRLRGDAAAKRAFWPQLRALRRRPS